MDNLIQNLVSIVTLIMAFVSLVLSLKKESRKKQEEEIKRRIKLEKDLDMLIKDIDFLKKKTENTTDNLKNQINDLQINLPSNYVDKVTHQNDLNNIRGFFDEFNDTWNNISDKLFSVLINITKKKSNSAKKSK